MPRLRITRRINCIRSARSVASHLCQRLVEEQKFRLCSHTAAKASRCDSPPLSSAGRRRHAA